MKFTFKKFGYIEEGSVELADLTLICGSNNVGKTYVSYAIYGFFKKFYELVDLSIDTEQLERLYDTSLIKIDLAELAQQDHIYFEKSSKLFTEELSSFFSASDDFFKNSLVIAESENIPFNSSASIDSQITMGTSPILIFSKEKNSSILNIAASITNVPQGFLTKEKFIVLFNRVISNIIKKILYIDSFYEPFAITSERTGIALFYKELDSNKYDVLAKMDLIDKSQTDKLLNQLRESTARYAEPIQDNIDIIRDYDQYLCTRQFS